MIPSIGSSKPRSASRRLSARHPLALAIASVLALAATQVHAGGPPVLTQAWLAQQQAHTGGQSAVASVPGSTLTGLAAQTPAQLLQQGVVQQSLADLNRAAQAVAAQISAQQAAQQAAQQQTSPVPNGLVKGGLQAAVAAAANPSLWQNANAPSQSSSNGQVTVEVKQTAQKAILTWDSFNIGRGTTLYFNQSGGTQANGSNNWIALNRIVDPSGVPSQIFGQIKAEGTVYLLNRNGILFGAGSQINTNSLLASSLDLFNGNVTTSNSAFLNGGIAASTTAFLVDGIFTDGHNHDVVVQAGASITSGAQGFTLLAAPNVSNAGRIVADDGQAILAAGSQFFDRAASSNGNALVVVDQSPNSGGIASNTGLLQARRGQIYMLGYNVNQLGIALASTSISYPGSIQLTARQQALDLLASTYRYNGDLVLGPGSVTAVLPEKDGATTTSSVAANTAFKPGSLNLGGSTVTFQSGSLLEAPGATLSIATQFDQPGPLRPDPRPNAGRIYFDNNAVVDVSGLANVQLPISALLVTIPRVGQNELADSPLLRNSFLYRQTNVVVDSTQSGTLANGLDWVGSPILNVAGYVQNVPRDISQLMTTGGTVNLTGYEVIVRSGAQLNLDGGYLAYQPGWITTPNLLGADGRIYNIAAADPQMAYVGFAGDYTVNHSRWGVSENYSNPLLAGSNRYDPGFAQGGNAGSLNIATVNALVMDGQISAQAFTGRNQVTQGSQPAGGLLSVNISPLPLLFAPKHGVAPGILLQQSAVSLDQLDSSFQFNTPWQQVLNLDDPSNSNPLDLAHWLPVSANVVSRGGFGSLTIDLNQSVTYDGQSFSLASAIQEQPGTVLKVAPGGSILLRANRITVLGQMSAPAGTISLTSSGPVLNPDGSSPPSADITLGKGASLNVSGLWANDTGLDADDYVGNRYINGGSISLSTDQATLSRGNNVTDSTGAIILQSGSSLTADSGGYVDGSGILQLASGVPTGRGGNISLLTYVLYGSANFQLLAIPPVLASGRLVLNGSLSAYGFSGGGSLSLQASDLQIGGSPNLLAVSSGLYLDPGFFHGQGFASYQLSSATDANIAAGSQIQVSPDNLLPNYTALLAAPSGTAIFSFDPVTRQNLVSLGQLDPYHRYITATAANVPGLSISAGAYLDWPSINNGKTLKTYPGVTGSVRLGAGASIAADAGSSVALNGTQATIVDGSIQVAGGHIDLSLLPMTGIVPLASLGQTWLGEQAVVDAAGTSLLNPLAAAVPMPNVGVGLASRFIPRSGVVLNGGQVSLDAASGYTLTQTGSLIDVSGAADVFDLPTAAGALTGVGGSYVATPVWSNAGSIVFAAGAGLYADGRLRGLAGSVQGEGGRLQVAGLSAPGLSALQPTAIILQQSGTLLPPGLQAGGVVEAKGPSGVLHFALDRLNQSGITALTIGPQIVPAAGSFVANVVPVGMAGNINLSLGRSFTLESSSLIALPAGSTSISPSQGYAAGNGTVSITAPYVDISGLGGGLVAPLAGDGVLNIHADFIDLGGTINLQQWSKASLSSNGDLRFYLPPASAYGTGTTPSTGILFSTGDVSLQAAQLYPISNYPFVIDANPSGLSDAHGNPRSTTLTILGHGASSTPLSAGGSLLLDANHILQQGTVRVPSGNLVLGVQDPVGTALAFKLPSGVQLVATQSVELAADSITSVSLGNTTVPYGGTVDGQQWAYSGSPTLASQPMTAPPGKSITIAASNVALDPGATVDLTGGGDLQAAEWTAGIGGTRDVLSQYQTSYANSLVGAQVPQYSDGRAIYAILPGYSAPVGAHDAALEKGAGAGPAVGQAVYLSGIDGLPAGTYTLLPAKYATVKGAYRLVQDTSSIDSVLGRNSVLPDGTFSITGYFANALNGARSARNTTFLVQSGPVWQQYSQYTLTDASSYFTNLANKAGTAVPYLPSDSGRLSLAASQQLQLGITLAPTSSGRGSQVDIAAQAIQVVSPGATALAGYLQLSADSLTALGAGSLMLGGSRQLGSDGYDITSIADSVVLSNNSAHPLGGQEILLVANGLNDPGAQGIVVAPGSALWATGTGPADSTALNFGRVAGTTSTNGTALAAVSGDGALLRVSQHGAAPVVRTNVSGTSTVSLNVGAGANLQAGSALTLDSTGATRVDPNAQFSASRIDADSNQISFVGSDPAAGSTASGLVVGPTTLALLRNAQQVSFNSRGSINFLGDVSLDLPQTLDLNANALVSDGGQVSITTARLGLGNALGSQAATPLAGAGQLTLKVAELDFTAGNSALQGFGTVQASASQGVAGEGTGSFNFGGLNVSLSTPLLMAESGANTTLTTTGSLSLNSLAGTALQREAMGGSLNLNAGAINAATRVEALAGTLSLDASAGDLSVANPANLSVAGLNKTFIDTSSYAPGGQLSLKAEQGSVVVQPGAVLNFAGAAQGGDAGSLSVQAAHQATLGGTLQGQTLSGYRGSRFNVSAGAAVDLNQVAQLATAAGITGALAVTSGAGNLVLAAGQVLRAQNVQLTANGDVGGGQIQIAGTVDVSGAAAGTIQLFGRNGVALDGSLLATSSVPEQAGGTVSLATSGHSDGSLNASYGYENIQPGQAGAIQFGPTAHIDVSGGSPDAPGSVSLRAPLLANGDVPISFTGAPISGAGSVNIEPYAIWSTDDHSTDPSQHFNGVIDPAGWYQRPASNDAPSLVAGSWTDASGHPLPAPTDAATLRSYLSNDYFTPAVANANHQSFFGYRNGNANQGPGTLMGYIQQPGYSFGNRFAGLANAQLRPGIELINPDAAVNGGDISVLSNWNLGAGQTAADGTIHLAYRYQPSAVSGSGQAPIISILAQNNLNIDASITDGFYQQNNGPTISAPAITSSGPTYAGALAAYQASNQYLTTSAFVHGDRLWQPTAAGAAILYYTDTGKIKSVNLATDPYYQPIQAPLAGQSVTYYQNYMLYIGQVGAGSNWSLAYNTGDKLSFLLYKPTTLVAPQPAGYASYSAYVASYQTWLTANFGGAKGTTVQTPSPLLLPVASEATTNYSLYSSDYASYIGGYSNYYTYVSTQVGSIRARGSQLFYAPYIPAANVAQGGATTSSFPINAPSNMPVLNSPVSLAAATLFGASSSSYRLVAGADFAAVDPLVVAGSEAAGNITMDGHFAVQDTTTVNESGAKLPYVDNLLLLFPTTVRTGTGSIDVAAAGDIDWLDKSAPATIYTAGQAAAGTTVGTGVVVARPTTGTVPDILRGGVVHPDNAGNISLSALGNINSIEQVYDPTGAISGNTGGYIGQFWWPWMQTGNPADGSGSSINFANFDQGVMSVGGNVAVSAGGNIRQLAVSLPTTWYTNPDAVSITTVGGGNLEVNAGGNILSGSYFVAKGQGSLTAGGRIGADFSFSSAAGATTLSGLTTPVSTLLALQDAQWNVAARQGVDMGGIFNPSYGSSPGPLPSLISTGHFDSQSYSVSSSVTALSTDGNISLGSLNMPSVLFGYGNPGAYVPGPVLPATLGFIALNGNISILGGGGLYPSATGNLSLLAAGSASFSQQNYSLGTSGTSFGLIDAPASMLPSPLQPPQQAAFYVYWALGYLPTTAGTPDLRLHQAVPLHANDEVPIRIYALGDDITDGIFAPNGAVFRQLVVESDKPALLYAGHDIENLSFLGQNIHASDITRIMAGHDIYDTLYNPPPTGILKPQSNQPLVQSILLGGPGSLLVQAGRNIGPLTNQVDTGGTGAVTGFETIGNQVNPYLAHDSANINVLFGVAPGIDTTLFLRTYLDTPGGVEGFGSLLPDLVAFMQQYAAGKHETGYAQDQTTVVLDASQAQAQFKLLPGYVQQLFVDQELFKLLAQVGADYNDPTSPYFNQYARGYTAIDTLFPATLGYTANGAGLGGLNGTQHPIDTGDLDMRSATIQTQQGGNISILGPGGQALVGSASAPPVFTNSRGQVTAGPNSMGILSMEKGDVNIFIDRSLLLAQSRIFTEQGGAMTIWSSNGDINAGVGAKTSTEVPPPSYLCTVDAYCLIDARGQVSGAGIATLQTIPGAPRGNVYLIAPRGTVDAGDAGIRVSGNLVIAAAQVLNADNIQVQGQKIGIPVAQSVNLGALNAANAAAGAVSKVAEGISKQQQNDALSKQPSIISVDILGFGDNSTSIQGQHSAPAYDPSSPVQILGAGRLSDSRKTALTAIERGRMIE